MKASTNRLTFPCYRCKVCGGILTRIEIAARWQEAEKAASEPGKPVSKGICPCGSSRIGPTNPRLWEELFLPKVWKLWWVEVVVPWWKEFINV